MVSATDVLRLVVAKNNGNTALTDNVRFKTLKNRNVDMHTRWPQQKHGDRYCAEARDI